MLRLLTNMNLLNRFDVVATAGLLASGVTGTFVRKNGDTLDLLAAAGDFAIGPVWTESNRDGTVGFTPDVGATGKLSIYYGKYRALTDQFSGTPTTSAKLYAGTDGKLSVTAGNGVVVAYCTKASHTISHLGTSHTVIEYVTV